MSGLQIPKSLHRFSQVGVLLFYKPTRLVSADCDQCQVKASGHVMRLGGVVMRVASAIANQRKKQRSNSRFAI